MDQRTWPIATEPEVAHALSGEHVLERLGATADGLSEDEAAARLEREGPNLLPEPHARPMRALFHTAPLGGREWCIAMALALAIFLLLEAEKLLVTRVEARPRR